MAKPGWSQGPTGLPQCKIRRKPQLSQGQTRFVPGTDPICPWDKLGFSLGQAGGHRKRNRTKKFMFVCFFLARRTAQLNLTLATPEDCNSLWVASLGHHSKKQNLVSCRCGASQKENNPRGELYIRFTQCRCKFREGLQECNLSSAECRRQPITHT